MRLLRSGRNRAISAAWPAASLLTENPTPSGRTCTSKRSFEISIPIKTSCDAIILSPSCDCGREPRQLFGREMKDSAGALLDTGEDPTIAYGHGAAATRTWPRPALRRTLWIIADRQDCFVASRNDVLVAVIASEAKQSRQNLASGSVCRRQTAISTINRGRHENVPVVPKNGDHCN